MRAAMSALGAKYRSNALAQEKTGEFWVDARLYGGHTRGDFEHAEVALFVGKNPWMSHGMPRARPTLREIARDPDRALIVIDPRRTETAALADHHLALRPGTDAWCLAALCAVIVQEGLTDKGFLASRTTGADDVLAALGAVPVEEFAAHCGLDPVDVRAVARRIANSSSMSTFEDLGMQQAPHSTLSSYLNKLLFLLVGSFGKSGGMGIHSDLVPLTRAEPGDDPRTPVTGARVIAGLIPANVVAEEILTDHPARYRAMVIQSANPAHSVADSQSFRRALAELDVGRLHRRGDDRDRAALRLRPAGGQPVREVGMHLVQLRVPAQHLPPPRPADGPAARDPAEAEIYVRLLDRLGALDGVDLDGLDRGRAARPRASSRSPSARPPRRTRASPRSRPWCSIERWGRRCPRAPRWSRRCGASRAGPRRPTRTPSAARASPARTPRNSASRSSTGCWRGDAASPSRSTTTTRSGLG